MCVGGGAALTHSQAEQQPTPALVKAQVIGQARAVLIAGNPKWLLWGLFCLLAGVEESKEASLEERRQQLLRARIQAW